VTLLTALAHAAAAQTTQGFRPALSLDATIGPGGGRTNGNYVEREVQAPALDVTLAVRARRETRSGFLAGLNWGAQGPAGGDDLICILRSDGRCKEDFPSFMFFGALVGWESARGLIRLAGGPAYARVDWDPAGLAIQARAELAAPVSRHLGLIASLRGVHVPNATGSRFSFYAVGLGARIH
jgi:hypothetical protein